MRSLSVSTHGKPYQPRPDDREAHGKLALPPLKDPTPHKDGDGNGSH